MSNKILLIHGWGVTHHIFNNLIINLPEYELITPDLPGYGNVSFQGDFNINNIADNLLNTIDNFPVHLLGWSMGGVISIIMAAKHPKKIKTLTLVSSFAKYLKDDTYIQGIKKDSLKNLYKLLDKDYLRYIKYFIEIQAYNPIISKSQTRDNLQNIFKDLTNKPASLLESLKEIMDLDVRNYLQDILIPTLIIYGRKDMVTPYPMQEYLNNNIKNSELICFDNSSHAAFLSEQDLFIDILKTFYIKNK